MKCRAGGRQRTAGKAHESMHRVVCFEHTRGMMLPGPLGSPIITDGRQRHDISQPDPG